MQSAGVTVPADAGDYAGQPVSSGLRSGGLMLAILMHGWVSAAHMLLVIVPTVPRR
jgi:hypothetical protein